MHRFLAIGLIVVAGLATAWGADAPTLSVNRDTIYEGESVILTVKVSDADEGSQPDLSGIPDARIAFRGSRDDNHFQISFINGKMQREGFSGRTYLFEVAPLNVGIFPGGPVRIAAQGKNFTLAFPRLEVKIIPRQNQALLELEAEPLTVLADMPFTVTLRLLVKRLDAPYADVPPFVPNDPPLLTAPYLDGNPIEGLDLPDIRKDLSSFMADQRSPGLRINQFAESRSPFDMGGFFDGADPFAQRAAKFLPPSQPVERDGISYFEYRIPFTFTAREEGIYTFGPATFKGNILTGVDAAKRGVTLMTFAVGRAATVRVAPPPEQGRPVSFFGLTGSNLVADAELSANSCRVGDPLKLTLKVRGPVNWRNAVPPSLAVISNLAARFQVYGSTLQTVKEGDGRNFSFTLRPLQPGTGEIPPIPFSWFDTQAQTYRTVYSSPIPLKVEPSTELMAGPWIDTHPETADAAPAATLFAKTPSSLRAGSSGAAGQERRLPLLALILIGPVLFALRLLLHYGLLAMRVRRKGRRTRNALTRALKTLALIRRDTTANPRDMAGRTSLMMRDFVADLLDRDPGGLTPPDAYRLLQERGIPETLARDYETVMTRLFQTAYSPESQPGTEAGDLSSLPDLLQRVFRQGSASQTAGPASKMFLFLILLGCGTGIGTQAGEIPDDRRRFEWDEAQSLAASAANPAAFHEAASHFNDLSTEGVRHGDLFYNMGTCLLLAGEPQNAWKAFVRAERYLGRPQDLVHNMELARTAMNGGEPAPLPWDRTLLFLHFGLPLAIRLQVAALCFLLFWVVWAIAWGRVRGSAQVMLAITLVGALLFGSSAAVTLFQESQELPLALSQKAQGETAHAPN